MKKKVVVKSKKIKKAKSKSYKKEVTAESLRLRYESDVAKLQKKCKHKEQTDWIDEWYAPAHSTGRQVKVCKKCGLTVAGSTITIEVGVLTTNVPPNTPSLATTENTGIKTDPTVETKPEVKPEETIGGDTKTVETK